tara:strand:- start:304 stop:927 length:624 start_codon:yes stop_codon:yes gene_type:complete
VFEFKPTINPLFPNLVYHTPFLTKDECEMYIKELNDVEKHSPDMQGNPYHTTDKLHLLNDSWKKLSDRVIEVINSVADHQKIKRDSFYTTCMWANISQVQEYFHKKHVHPNSFFSSIIYLRGNQSSSTIFYDPRSQSKVIQPDYSEINDFNSTAYHLPFIEGSLVIFPSWLPHSVSGNNNDNRQRITISSNSMMHSEITSHTSYLKI